MPVASFMYHKTSGEKSFRRVYILVEEENSYLGIDVTKMSAVEVEHFVKEMSQVEDDVEKVICTFDMQDNYRRFTKSRIKELSIA